MNGPEHVLGPFDTARLRVVPAAPDDADELQACLDAAPDFFLRTEGAPAAEDDAAQRLDDAEADDRRAVFAIRPRSGGAAVGVLDVHLGVPEPDAVHVGLLLFRESCQGRGYGREVVTALEAVLARAGWAAMRLSVGDENPGARAFWEALGFAESGRIDRGVTVLEKPLRRTT